MVNIHGCRMDPLLMLLVVLTSVTNVVLTRSFTPIPTPGIVTADLKDGEQAVEIERNSTLKIICGRLNEFDENPGTIWLKNGIQINYDDFPTINLHPYSLIIHRATENESGIYGCEVRDSMGNLRISRNVTVKVNSKLSTKSVTDDPRGIKETTNIVSDEDDYQYPPGQDDYKNENETHYLDEDDEEEISQEKQDALTSCENKVTVSKMTRNESYLCFDFSHKKQMTHYHVRPAGTTFKLFCNVKGNPSPSIRWLKNGAPVQKSSYQTKILKNAIQLVDVGVNAGGIYICEVSSGDPQVGTLEYEIQLEVSDRYGFRPILIPFKNKTYVEGERLQLPCDFKSDDGLLQPFFYKRDVYTTFEEFVQLDLSGKIAHLESRTMDNELADDVSSLVLDNVTLADEGWYTCIVGNSIGRSFTSAYISVVTEVPKEVSKIYPRQVDLNHYQIAFVSIAIILFILLVICFAVCIHSKKQERLRRIEAKTHHAGWTKQVIIERRPIDDEEGSILIPEVNIKNVESTKSGQEYELPIDWSWEFPREKLTLGEKLGEGAFGEVLLGRAEEILPGQGIVAVAVKSLKKTHTDAELIDLISEMETMKVLGRNTNIINLLGCCTQGGDLLVIMEFCEEGNLRDYLRRNRHNYFYRGPPIGFDLSQLKVGEDILTFKDLMSFAFQVARGMDYLVQRKYVHRDLAARNVLVTTGRVVKIADFGMTRSTFTNDYYRKKSDGRVPVKWMAPETLFHRIYTTQSDVWSYGILLWEIVTLGGSPYPSMPDVNKLLDFLKSGSRMERPANCPHDLYMIMLYCWFYEPAARPPFSELAEDMDRILHIAADNEYMDMENIREFDEMSDAQTEIVKTPESSPENSSCGMIFFDPSLLSD